MDVFFNLTTQDYIRQFEADEFNVYYIDRLATVYVLNRGEDEVQMISHAYIEVNNKPYYTVEVAQVRFQDEYMN